MSEFQPDSRVDHDPLLDFSTEPGIASIAPTQPQQPIASTGVLATASPDASVPATESALFSRIDRLEKNVDRCAQEIVTLRSELATLVGAQADIKHRAAGPVAVVKPPRTHLGPDPTSGVRTQSGSGPKHVLRHFVGAVAGIVIGIASGMWIWTAMSSETLIPAAPIVAAATQPIAVTPERPAPVDAPAPPPAPAIVPVASVTPVHNTPPPPREPRESRAATRPVGYVGTLSIDSDPPADVFIDRKAAGRTPLTAPNLKAGSHLIWIERDGYRRFTRVVEVPADRVSRVVADLESIAPR